MIPAKYRDQIIFEKSSINTEHAELFGAFDNGDTLTFSLTLPRALGAASPCIEFFRDSDAKTFALPLVWQGNICVSPALESYGISIPLIDMCNRESGETSGLFYYSAVFGRRADVQQLRMPLPFFCRCSIWRY